MTKWGSSNRLSAKCREGMRLQEIRLHYSKCCRSWHRETIAATSWGNEVLRGFGLRWLPRRWSPSMLIVVTDKLRCLTSSQMSDGVRRIRYTGCSGLDIVRRVGPAKWVVTSSHAGGDDISKVWTWCLESLIIRCFTWSRSSTDVHHRCRRSWNGRRRVSFCIRLDFYLCLRRA